MSSSDFKYLDNDMQTHGRRKYVDSGREDLSNAHNFEETDGQNSVGNFLHREFPAKYVRHPLTGN